MQNFIDGDLYVFVMCWKCISILDFQVAYAILIVLLYRRNWIAGTR